MRQGSTVVVCPMPRATSKSETDYVNDRLRPVLDRLHTDREMRARFLRFAEQRGGDLSMMVQRLQTAWWRSRTPQFVHFFVLTLTEFGIEEGLITVPSLAARPTSAHPKDRGPRGPSR